MKKAIFFIFIALIITGCVANKFIALTMPSGEKIKAKPAIKSDEFTKGLSGIDRLDGYEAMFFIKDKAERVCFWMKGMRFPLDIIYLDGQKQVQQIFSSLTPCLEGRECPSYCSQSDSIKYILEIPAGQLEKFNIKIDSQIN